MSSPRVLIFGPTGGVGKAAAAEAHRRGGQVTLAMRDTSKKIEGLPDLPRVQADLSDPSSISEAVKKSGATAAFVYTMDDMEPTFKALKEAGIDYVVLLSSWTIYPDDIETAAKTSHAIPMKHAKAEIALQKSGLKFSPVRPLYFASNVTFESAGIKKGEVGVLNPDGVWDYIAPEDIGTVAGAKLFSEPEIVDVIGPDLITPREAFKIIGDELGREIKIKEINYDDFAKSGNPMAESFAKGTIRKDEEKYPPERRKAALETTRKYEGRDPMSFKEWVKLHRQDLES